jgi:hypothetical protein
MPARPRRGLLVIVSAFLALAPRPGADPVVLEAQPAALSAAAFAQPPRAAGVHAWWHWVDGAITREGITKDLEALAAQGVVQVTILNVGLFGTRDLGVPRVPFASPEWFAMFRWALAEAHRLGITVGVHNCDGWSSSGGPWITPELSMKQFVWTKTLVEGGRPLDLSLLKPAEIAGFYRDVAVVAFPTPQRPSGFRSAAPHLRVNGAETPMGPLFDGCPISTVRIKPGDRLELESSSALTFDRLAVHVRRPFMWGDPAKMVTRLALQTSDDGREYRTLAELSVRGLNGTQVLTLPRASARFVRVTVGEITDSDPWFPIELGELELLQDGESPAHSPTIPFIAQKTSAIVAASDDDVYTVGTDAVRAPVLGDVVVLTDKMDADGRIRWQPPAGSWAVLRFGYTSTGSTNNPATDEGRGLECDKMDPAAVEHHFRGFPEKAITEAREHAGGTFRFVLVDSWEAGFQNWTARLPMEFEKRRGYSLVSWLPALTGETIGSSRDSEAALFDLRQTIADLIRESYYDRTAALLHERKVELHAEVIYGGGGYPPLDVLRSTRQVDLPMFEYWTTAGDDALIAARPVAAPELNLPAAAAAGYGKPLVGSEAYTGYATYSESFADLKPFGDRAFTAGLNRMILHSSVHQPTDEAPGLTLGKFGSHFNRNNSTWAYAGPWLTYQARIQSVLGEGTPVFDVLYFLGDQLPQSFARNASTTLPAGYAVTAVNAELLSDRITVADGRLQLAGAGSAALLTLPPQPSMSLETLKRIETVVRDGGRVYGPKPIHTLSLADGRQADAFRAIADRVWGSVDGKAVFTNNYGKGGVAWGQPVGQVLASMGVPPQFSATPAGERDFLFIHRRVGGDDVFFVVNQWDRGLARECAFRVGASTPEIWDPETGLVARPAAFRSENGVLRLPVRFRPRQALLFVFRAGAPRPHVTSIARGDLQVFPAAQGGGALAPDLRFEGDGIGVVADTPGSFTFGTSDGRTLAGRFDAPQPVGITGPRGTLELRATGTAARTIEVADLRSLTDFAEPEIRYFSGEATYRLRFTAPDTGSTGTDRLLLDLGDFEATADVTLNGRSLGRFWRPGVPLDVTGSLRRENELVVIVAIVYRNRLIGDLAQFGDVRSVHTSSPVADLLSPAKPLKRAGLLGPVRLTRVPTQRVTGM